jgi:tetratricopeptide (TPR) repeat protein
MTKQQRALLHKRDSTRHFLFSKTDTKELERKQIAPRESAWKTLKEAFPEMLSGKRFVDHAMDRLKSTARFGALAIRLDSLPQRTEQFDKYRKIAQALQIVCEKENGLWGIVEPGILDCFLPDKNAAQCLKFAQSFQKTIVQEISETITVGIAKHPTLDYYEQQILDNTRKALDHAAFFGPGSTAVFDAVSLNISGDRLYEKGDIKEAVVEFRRALRIDPSNVNVHNSLGVCYAVAGDYKKAVKQFKAAVDLDPNEFMALYNQGLIKMLKGQRDSALELFLRAELISEDVFEIVYQTGKLYLEKRELEKAQKYFEKALRIKPNTSAVYRHLGESYAASGRSQDAVRSYKHAIKQNPADAASLSALGCLFDEQGENPEISIMFCQESVDLSPQNGLFRLRLGRLYLKQNLPEKALKEFEKAEELGQNATAYIDKIRNQLKAKAS